MIEVYHTCREINTVLPHLVALALGWRVASQWHLPWVLDHAKPWTRRFLGIYAVALVLLGMQAVQYEAAEARTGPVSPVITLVSLTVAYLCWHWPTALASDEEDV